MTLKEFMTRGMEKDAAAFQFGKPGSERFMTYNADPNYSGNFDDTALSKLPGPLMAAKARPAFWNEYWAENPDIQKQLMWEFQSLLNEALPNIDNKEFLGQLDKDRLIAGLSKNFLHGKPSKVLPGLIDEFKQQSMMNPFLLNMAKNHPDLFKAFAHKWVLQSMMKQVGMDPSKVYELAPDLANYDMNQHLPGMALAFGLPLGIGAFLGHPGWGALLGMLGAGAYGYYQYNKMRQHPFAQVPNAEAPAANDPGIDPVTGETQALPGPGDTTSDEASGESASTTSPKPEVQPPAQPTPPPTTVTPVPANPQTSTAAPNRSSSASQGGVSTQNAIIGSAKTIFNGAKNTILNGAKNAINSFIPSN